MAGYIYSSTCCKQTLEHVEQIYTDYGTCCMYIIVPVYISSSFIFSAHTLLKVECAVNIHKHIV